MTLILGVAIFGFLCSIFFGCFAEWIFNFFGRKPAYENGKEPGPLWRPYQFWFNFICSAVGWAIAIYYVHRLQIGVSQFSFRGEDAILVVISLLGITGILPRTLFWGGKFPGQ